MKAAPRVSREEQRHWMRRALRLAARGEGRTRPNPPVGAVVVRNGQVAGAGYHRQAGQPHAEIEALRAAGARARGATLYVTLEPCCTRGRTGPCTEAILAAGIAETVVATRDPNPRHGGRGLHWLTRNGVRVVEGICEAPAREMLRPFAKWIVEKIPYVTLKMGMTLDGRIGDAQGRSRWITGEASRRQVARLRSRSDAIMVGARTARADDPGLLSAAGNEPWRVVVDARGEIPLGARVLNDDARRRTLLAVGAPCPPALRAAGRRNGVTVAVLPMRQGRVCLESLMRRLGEMGVLRVLCEGGGELAAELVRQERVDEFVFFVAPRLLGGGGTVPVLGGSGWPLEQTPRLRFVQTRKTGEDLMIRAVPENPGGERAASSP
jgi:diaminohydroxyphosphoribosylaminopyrimidine deaminase / 5-amino-6-(5-phosphoribosylamino)uracil reductase